MAELALTGLNGTTFLGFLAGLGTLRAVSASGSKTVESRPRLSWREASGWHPMLSGVSDFHDVANCILTDARSRAVDAVLDFKYVKQEKGGPKTVHHIAAPLSVFRGTVTSLLIAGHADVAGYLGTLMCESAPEEIPEAKLPSEAELRNAGIPWDADTNPSLSVGQSPFDFTSRNVQFLDQVRRIRDALTPDAIVAELELGLGTPCERIMRWDALVDSPSALFSGVSPMPHPVAEWLAFRGVSFFPLVAEGGRARVAGLVGRRKAGEFTWPLWSVPLTEDVIASTLRLPWASTAADERRHRGIQACFTVSLRKDATGYDGAVSPGAACVPSAGSRR